MRDYDGDMKPFQDALAKKGITQEMLDMEQFRGLTADELWSIVRNTSLKNKGDEK